MAFWNEVMSLVQDLDQLVSSYTHFVWPGARIKCVAQEAGNYIGFRVCTLNVCIYVYISLPSTNKRYIISCNRLRSRGVQFDVRTGFVSGVPTLTRITEEILSINEELKKIHDRRNVQEHLELTTSSTGKSSTFLSRPRRTPIAEGKLVGLEKELVTMLDNLTGHPLQLKVFSIIDDMWDTEAWEDLKRTFPDDKNGSRVTLTSRLRDVAVHACQDTSPHSMRCLSIHESWELLSSKIFVDEPCPMELLTIGKQIACKCQGLPLAIVVVGGLLSKMDKKLDVWDNVAQSVGSLVLGEADHCQNILALSYNHLPDHLKACFLYMGIFPEDYEISVKKLVWLWVAEGFIRPSMLKSLEEVAEDYLEDLITRSLIMVKRRSSSGRIKTCYIHDLMRELCVRESQKEGFFRVIKSGEQLILKNLHDDEQRWMIGTKESAAVDKHLHNLRRLSFQSNFLSYINTISFQHIRSIMFFEKLSLSNPSGYLGMNFMLLKVLDIMNIHLRIVPSEIAYLTLLKFMALTIVNDFISQDILGYGGVKTFSFDQELSINSPIYYTKSASTSVLSLQDAEVRLKVLKNLQTLSTIRPVNCTQKVFLSIPNLKKLGIYQTEEDYRFRGWFEQLVHLQELETLKYAFSNPFVSSALKPDRVPSWRSFPQSL
ncbi:putative disease resistance RPP13-like protein 3 [Sesamum angolense]|uniref:Disease resistance RPP13-like protein 3 n=1 Tax=Sesamum angolense TaxID=2727404 RepID=A0AAE1VYW5_9LAMI|nr:putative disease resistance RPP13-like protein 3 [Sesamum angolense]